MSVGAGGEMIDLANIYSDLASALGAARKQAAREERSSDWFAHVAAVVQRLWARSVRELAAGRPADELSHLPTTVEPDDDGALDLDVQSVLDHVEAFSRREEPPAGPGRGG